MGVYRCAAPGCATRVGQGRLFKKFPRAEALKKMWLQRLPTDFQPTVHTHLCELHFGQDQFERPREDGKRKFKEAAVPTLLERRQALGNITNIAPLTNCISSSFTRSARQLQKINQENVSPVHLDHTYSNRGRRRLLSYHDSNGTDCAPTFPEAPPQPADFSQNSVRLDDLLQCDTVAPYYLDEIDRADKLVLDNPSQPADSSQNSVRHDDLPSCVDVPPTYLDETDHAEKIAPDNPPQPADFSQNFLITHSPCQPADVSPNSVTPPDKMFCHGHIPPVTLDDVMIKIEGSTVTVEDVTSTSPNEKEGSQELNNNSPAELHLEYQSEVVSQSNIIHILSQQRAELESLKEDIIRKDKAYEKLTSKYEETVTKYRAERRQSAKLKIKLDRAVHCPWLTPSQQKILTRRKTGGVKWPDDLIREGLILKMKSGSTGYAAWVKRLPLFPSNRTLQEAVQFIKFESGLLSEMFDLVQEAMKDMDDKDTDCILVLDEMAIEAGERFDPSTKKWVGAATLPSHDGVATKALLVLLAGVRTRWKIPAAVYFTNHKKSSSSDKNMNHTGEAYQHIIDTVIRKAESIGQKVCAVVSDMGPDNLAFWKKYGINANRKQETSHTFPNPVREGTEIAVMPDGIHLFKAIKTMMEKNKIIMLSESVVKEQGLSTGVVDYKHVEDLYEFEEDCELKVAFRLKPQNIHCSKHFEKMNVGTHRAVVCHRTAVGLELLAKETRDDSYKTTAWFFEQLNTFFELISARSRHLAISKHCAGSYQKAIEMICNMAFIFKSMAVGAKKEWKPCQRGMLVLCAGLLHLQNYFLEKRGYKYLILGRFTSDCIENVFSCIRLSQPTPHAIAFLQNLKVLALAQLSEAVQKSNYDYDPSEMLPGTDILSIARNKANDRQVYKFWDTLDEQDANPIPQLTDRDLAKIGIWEQNVIYDMAGNAVHNIITSNVKVCDTCVMACMWNNEESHPRAVVVQTKEFTTLCNDDNETEKQVYVSDEVFKGVLTAEVTFRICRSNSKTWKHMDVENYLVDNLMYVWGSRLPNCHNIGRKILQFYIRNRLKQYGSKIRLEMKEAAIEKNVKQRSSKSMAYRQVIDHITTATVQK